MVRPKHVSAGIRRLAAALDGADREDARVGESGGRDGLGRASWCPPVIGPVDCPERPPSAPSSGTAQKRTPPASPGQAVPRPTPPKPKPSRLIAHRPPVPPTHGTLSPFAPFVDFDSSIAFRRHLPVRPLWLSRLSVTRFIFPPPGCVTAELEAMAASALTFRNGRRAVYVDGFYAGVVDDFNGTVEHLNLTPEPHHIELHAPGFETTAFDVSLEVGRISSIGLRCGLAIDATWGCTAMRTDKELQESVVKALDWEASVNAAQIDVTVQQGVVTLAGRVGSLREKWMAEKATRHVWGVRAIANDLAVALEGASVRTDTAIASAAVNALGGNSAIPPDLIQVTVCDGWVTLTGPSRGNTRGPRRKRPSSICMV